MDAYSTRGNRVPVLLVTTSLHSPMTWSATRSFTHCALVLLSWTTTCTSSTDPKTRVLERVSGRGYSEADGVQGKTELLHGVATLITDFLLWHSVPLCYWSLKVCFYKVSYDFYCVLCIAILTIDTRWSDFFHSFICVFLFVLVSYNALVFLLLMVGKQSFYLIVILFTLLKARTNHYLVTFVSISFNLNIAR